MSAERQRSKNGWRNGILRGPAGRVSGASGAAGETGIVNGLAEHYVQCPCCWQIQSVLVDHSTGDQEYVEDCQVCCQPMVLRVRHEAGEVRIEARPENG